MKQFDINKDSLVKFITDYVIDMGQAKIFNSKVYFEVIFDNIIEEKGILKEYYNMNFLDIFAIKIFKLLSKDSYKVEIILNIEKFTQYYTLLNEVFSGEEKINKSKLIDFVLKYIVGESYGVLYDRKVNYEIHYIEDDLGNYSKNYWYVIKFGNFISLNIPKVENHHSAEEMNADIFINYDEFKAFHTALGYIVK